MEPASGEDLAVQPFVAVSPLRSVRRPVLAQLGPVFEPHRPGHQELPRGKLLVVYPRLALHLLAGVMPELELAGHNFGSVTADGSVMATVCDQLEET